MTLHGNLQLSLLYENLLMHKGDVDGTDIDDPFWSGYHSCLRHVIKMVVEMAEQDQPLRGGRQEAEEDTDDGAR